MDFLLLLILLCLISICCYYLISNIFIFKNNAVYIVCFHIFASFLCRDELWQEADNSFRFFFERFVFTSAEKHLHFACFINPESYIHFAFFSINVIWVKMCFHMLFRLVLEAFSLVNIILAYLKNGRFIYLRKEIISIFHPIPHQLLGAHIVEVLNRKNKQRKKVAAFYSFYGVFCRSSYFFSEPAHGLKILKTKKRVKMTKTFS